MRGLCVILVVGTFAAVASKAAEGDLERLSEARAQWAAADSDAYLYAYEKYCECYRNDQPQTVVNVVGGQIERVFHLHENSAREVPAREGSLDLYWTIDDLFAKIDGALTGQANVRVEYDEALGYPVSLYIDYDPDFIGDETDIRVTRLELR